MAAFLSFARSYSLILADSVTRLGAWSDDPIGSIAGEIMQCGERNGDSENLLSGSLSRDNAPSALILEMNISHIYHEIDE